MQKALDDVGGLLKDNFVKDMVTVPGKTLLAKYEHELVPKVRDSSEQVLSTLSAAAKAASKLQQLHELLQQ